MKISRVIGILALLARPLLSQPEVVVGTRDGRAWTGVVASITQGGLLLRTGGAEGWLDVSKIARFDLPGWERSSGPFQEEPAVWFGWLFSAADVTSLLNGMKGKYVVVSNQILPLAAAGFSTISGEVRQKIEENIYLVDTGISGGDMALVALELTVAPLLVDGSRLSCVAQRIGTISYDTVLGAKKTVWWYQQGATFANEKELEKEIYRTKGTAFPEVFEYARDQIEQRETARKEMLAAQRRAREKAVQAEKAHWQTAPRLQGGFRSR